MLNMRSTIALLAIFMGAQAVQIDNEVGTKVYLGTVSISGLTDAQIENREYLDYIHF